MNQIKLICRDSLWPKIKSLTPRWITTKLALPPRTWSGATGHRFWEKCRFGGIGWDLEKLTWMRFETHFLQIDWMFVIVLFQPPCYKWSWFELAQFCREWRWKIQPPFHKLVDFLKDWAIEVASENDRSLASFGPAAQKSDGREGCYKLYIWINHDMYKSCVIIVKWNVNI